MELLLAKDGVDPDSKDNDSRTPLSLAAKEGREAVAKLLLKNGAELESKDKYSQSPAVMGCKERA